ARAQGPTQGGPGRQRPQPVQGLRPISIGPRGPSPAVGLAFPNDAVIFCAIRSPSSTSGKRSSSHLQTGCWCPMGSSSSRARRPTRPRALLLVLLLASAPRVVPAASLTRQDLLQALHHRQQMIQDWGDQAEKQIRDLQAQKLREEVYGWLQQWHAMVDQR